MTQLTNGTGGNRPATKCLYTGFVFLTDLFNNALSTDTTQHMHSFLWYFAHTSVHTCAYMCKGRTTMINAL